MIESIDWLQSFIGQYPTLEYLVIFLVAGFGGEFGMFILGFLSAQGVISLTSLCVFSFLGALVSDSLWFVLGKTKILKNIITHKYTNTTITTINQGIEKISRKNDLLAFIITKFMVGTRVLLIMYVGNTNLEFKKFIRNDIVALIIWLCAMISVGFLSGLGFVYFAEILKNIYAGIGFFLLVVLGIISAQIFIKRKFAKKEE